MSSYFFGSSKKPRIPVTYVRTGKSLTANEPRKEPRVLNSLLADITSAELTMTLPTATLIQLKTGDNITTELHNRANDTDDQDNEAYQFLLEAKIIDGNGKLVKTDENPKKRAAYRTPKNKKKKPTPKASSTMKRRAPVKHETESEHESESEQLDDDDDEVEIVDQPPQEPRPPRVVALPCKPVSIGVTPLVSEIKARFTRPENNFYDQWTSSLWTAFLREVRTQDGLLHPNGDRDCRLFRANMTEFLKRQRSGARPAVFSRLCQKFCGHMNTKHGGITEPELTRLRSLETYYRGLSQATGKTTNVWTRGP